MKIKMNVVGKEIFTVDTETGIISGQTYGAKKWIKETFEARWDGDKKAWVASTSVIAKEFEDTRYCKSYIVDQDLIVDGKIEIKKEEKKTVVNRRMVDDNSEYYTRVTYSDGTKKNFY